MLKLAPNKENDREIIFLNHLIRQFNHAVLMNEKVCLLQQIQWLADSIFVRLQRDLVDNLFINPQAECTPREIQLKLQQRKRLNQFMRWHANYGLRQALHQLGEPALLGMAAEKNFMRLAARYASPMPTLAEWLQQLRVRISPAAANWQPIDTAMALLERIKTNTPGDKIAYYQQLNGIKNLLLSALTKNELTRSQRLSFQRLLGQVNRALNETTNELSMFQWHYQQTLQSNQLLTPIFSSSYEQVVRPFLLALVDNKDFSPPKAHFKLKRLGLSGNSKNWKATLAHNTHYLVQLCNGDQYQFQTEQLVYQNPIVCQHLTKRYSTYLPGVFPLIKGEDFNAVVIVGEFCELGDLKSYRTQFLGLLASEEALNDAINLAMQSSELIVDFFNQGFLYPDIKLENLLINNQGKVVVSDLKAVRPRDLTTNKHAITKSFPATFPFEPPEARQKPPYEVEIEKYTAYQLGILLYDLMINDRASWIRPFSKALQNNNNPVDVLEFSKPLFSTAKGQQIKQLITHCLDYNPHQRPTLSHVMAELQALNAGYQLQLPKRSPVGQYQPSNKAAKTMSAALVLQWLSQPVPLFIEIVLILAGLAALSLGLFGVSWLGVALQLAPAAMSGLTIGGAVTTATSGTALLSAGTYSFFPAISTKKSSNDGSPNSGHNQPPTS